jgi:hypothetical protein
VDKNFLSAFALRRHRLIEACTKTRHVTADRRGPRKTQTHTTMIKTLTVLVIASALSITANAHPGGKGTGKRGQRGQIPAELLQKYDKNNDGALDEAERAVVNEEDKAKLGGHHGKGRGGKGGRGPGKGGKGGPGAGKPAAN